MILYSNEDFLELLAKSNYTYMIRNEFAELIFKELSLDEIEEIKETIERISEESIYLSISFDKNRNSIYIVNDTLAKKNNKNLEDYINEINTIYTNKTTTNTFELSCEKTKVLEKELNETIKEEIDSNGLKIYKI